MAGDGDVTTGSASSVPEVVKDQPPVEWADAWLKLVGIRTTFREREQLIAQFKKAMDYAVIRERSEVARARVGARVVVGSHVVAREGGS